MVVTDLTSTWLRTLPLCYCYEHAFAGTILVMTRSDNKWSFSGFVVFCPSTMKCWLWVRVEPALWMVREQGRSHYTLKFTCKNTAGRPRTRALV